MTTVGVVAHHGKRLGGGLAELRSVLGEHGVVDPLWYEVPKSKRAPARVKDALDAGVDLLFVWGGDGMVQRCLDALDGAPVPVAIVPAGTANLLASNLGVPTDLRRAVEIGLYGTRRAIDTGTLDGERFAVMAGIGLDALMIRDAGGSRKGRYGRLAYVVAGSKHLRMPRFDARVRVDGVTWFRGPAGCVLVGNMGSIFGGIDVFPDASDFDGRLEVGVVTAKGVVQWLRALARTATGHASASPFVHTTSGRKIRVDLDREVPVELDGGDRAPRRRVKLRVDPSSVVVCVPTDTGDGGGGA